MKVLIGSDHAGFNPKDDYPDFAKKVARKVLESPRNKGIVICGTGLGSCIER